MNKTKTKEAVQRLMYQAEIGGWYKDDSTVPVRIGDLYEAFKELRIKRARIEELESVLKGLLNEAHTATKPLHPHSEWSIKAVKVLENKQ